MAIARHGYVDDVSRFCRSSFPATELCAVNTPAVSCLLCGGPLRLPAAPTSQRNTAARKSDASSRKKSSHGPELIDRITTTSPNILADYSANCLPQTSTDPNGNSSRVVNGMATIALPLLLA